MDNQCYSELFARNIVGDTSFQKLQNIWVAKTLMSPYILCKIWSFETQITE